jgi:hypothetical protein
MTRVKSLICVCCLALLGAVGSASAAPLPSAAQAKPAVGALAMPVDYTRCDWVDGERFCRTYESDDDDVDFDDDYDYGYDPASVYDYGAPGVYLGFGGVGFGHRHGGGHFVRH